MVAWGRKRAAQPRASELERLAAEVEARVLAMPDLPRRRVLAAVHAIIAAARGMRELPDEVGEVLGKIVFRFIRDLYLTSRKPDPAPLVRQLVAGAPTLLGPHQQAIEEFLSAVG
jgi:hypothetical protein